MSPFKSSNSLQNSANIISFSRDGRFNGMYKKNLSETIYTIPDNKCQRYTSQGLGNRMELKNPAGKGSPAPNAYRIKSCFENSVDHKKGALFLEKFTPIVI